MFDNYGQVYDNTWESIPDDDLEVSTKVMESEDRHIVNMLDFLHETGIGLFVGDTWYEWDQIKHLWESQEG